MNKNIENQQLKWSGYMQKKGGNEVIRGQKHCLDDQKIYFKKQGVIKMRKPERFRIER